MPRNEKRIRAHLGRKNTLNFWILKKYQTLEVHKKRGNKWLP